MENITRVIIKGLHGIKDVDFKTRNGSFILVGENGTGKTTILNIVYYFITRQWSRLVEYNFHSVTIYIKRKKLTATRDEVSTLANIIKRIDIRELDSEIILSLNKIMKNPEILRSLIYRPTNIGMSETALRKLSDIGINAELAKSIRSFSRAVFRFIEPDNFSNIRFDLELELKSHFRCKIIYLPTYRRIEKELSEIAPKYGNQFFEEIDEFEDVDVEENFVEGRSAEHYIELVSFGMNDVKKIFKRKTEELSKYSLEKYNKVSSKYLSDVLRNQVNVFPENIFATLSEVIIRNVLSRVSEEAISSEDKELLIEKLLSIKKSPSSTIPIEDRYLAYYFVNVFITQRDISARESTVREFAKVANGYINPNKIVELNDVNFEISLRQSSGNEISLDALSSGEKQVFSIFSHLYLKEDSNYIIIIDEPELSLSVLWQQKFLVDILESPNCMAVLSATHSPFIFKNELFECVVDVSSNTKMSTE